jgi:hypothetical protein
VTPAPGAYAKVDEHMQAGGAGCLFHWDNGSARSDVWHTNFFAVALSHPEFWPPVAAGGDADVLERQWGRQLQSLGYPGDFWKTHNADDRRFAHRHEEPRPLPAPDAPPPAPARAGRGRRWSVLWLA